MGIDSLPEGLRVVAMTEHKDKIYVATERSVFRLDGDKLVPLKFLLPNPDVEAEG